MLVFGIFSLFHVALTLAGFPSLSRYPMLVDAAAAVVWFTLGLAFFFFASRLTGLAYADEP